MKRKQLHKKNILLTGGRGPAVLDLARQLHQAGHRLIMAESSRIYFARFSNAINVHELVPNPALDEEGFIKALLDLVERHQIDYLIPGYDEGFYIAKHKNRFPNTVNVFVEEAAIIDSLNNKFKFIQVLDNLNLNAPYSVLVRTREKLKEVLSGDEFARPCIAKSIYSAGGLMAKTIREETDVDALDINFPCIVQSMIPGRVWSTFSVAHEGKMTYFVSYYPLHTFRENGAAICFKTEYNQGVYDTVKRIIQGTNYSGLIGFDIIEKEDGTLWPIECNPRITSGAHLARTVNNFASCVLDPSTSLRTVPDDQIVQLSRASMLRILCAPLKTSFISWLKDFIRAKDVLFDRKDIKPTLGIPLVGILFFHQYIKYKKAAEENIFLNIDWGE